MISRDLLGPNKSPGQRTEKSGACPTSGPTDGGGGPESA